jgi:tetratricopeptide (TPR) repeat protein/O-antigen ligase
MTHLSSGFLVLWLLSLLIWRRRSLLSTTVFFHASILIAYSLRAAQAHGAMTDWFFWIGIGQWIIVLVLTVRRPDFTAAPSMFLAICFISPLYLFLLNASQNSIWGIPFWTVLVVHLAITLQAEDIRVPGSMMILIALSVLAIPSSVYPWHSVQFLLINAGCVILYSVTSQAYGQDKGPLKAGYLFLTCSILLFVLIRHAAAIQTVGSSLFGMRHYVVEHPNTIAPLLVILASIVFSFTLDRNHSTLFKSFLILLLALLALLEFLTYSRIGWLAFGCFLFLAGVILCFEKRHSQRWLVPGIAAAILLVVVTLSIFPAVQATLAQRKGDIVAISSRAFSWQMGLKGIASRPFFGSGWMNHYSHTALADSNALQLISVQSVIASHDHSFFLDVAEAGGIAMGIFFCWLTLTHLRLAKRDAALFAGLAGITINNVLDTGSLWLTVYSHFWILLSMIKGSHSSADVSGFRLRSSYALILLVVGGFLPMITDYYLLRGSFYYRNHESRKAFSALHVARILSPLDALPLETLTQVYLAVDQPDKAESSYHRLLKLRTHYAPYYDQIGTILLAQQKYERARKYLSKAAELDPQVALQGNAYVHLAFLADLQVNESEFREYLSRAFLYLRAGSQDFTARYLLTRIEEADFLTMLFVYARQQAPNLKDRHTALDNAYFNLMNIRAEKTAERLLEKILSEHELLLEEEIDYFAHLLAVHYLKSGEIVKLQGLLNIVSKKAGTLLQARIEILKGNHQRASSFIQQAREFYFYNQIADVIEIFYQKTNQIEKLHDHYRTLQNLPLLVQDATPIERLAFSYVEMKDYKKAAKAFQDVSRYRYDDPVSHWRRARLLYLAGDLEKARQVNRTVQRLIPTTWLTENLYRSEIEAPFLHVFIVRASNQNRYGGATWRAGIFCHPPATIRFPGDRTFTQLEGEVAQVWNAWSEETNGVRFMIADGEGRTLYSKKIDPRANSEERGWSPISWRSRNGPHQIVLQTDALENPQYDWSIWVIVNAR